MNIQTTNKLLITLLTLFAFCVYLTARPAHATPTSLEIDGKWAQSKIVKEPGARAYLTVSIDIPEVKKTTTERKPTDIIVVIDTSGSMAGSNKIDFARTATTHLVDSLAGTDRIAIITFSDGASVIQDLTHVGYTNRATLNSAVRGLKANGSTNMEAALRIAKSLLHSNSDRTQKVLLLSDGQPTTGCQDVSCLNNLGRDISSFGGVLSTIGLGLDFNEALLTSLSDYGAGYYTYLESMSMLQTVFAREFQDSKELYAENSHLTITIPAGVTLEDASGFPTRCVNRSCSIPTGQLLGSRKREITLSFNIENAPMGSLLIEGATLNYSQNGKKKRHDLTSEKLKLDVVAQTERKSAQKSIDAKVMANVVQKNTLGKLQIDIADDIKTGRKSEAAAKINRYRQVVNSMPGEVQDKMDQVGLEQQLQEMEGKVADSFSGSRREQETKRKMNSKSYQYLGNNSLKR